VIKFLKKAAKAVLDGTVIPAVHYVQSRTPGTTVLRELEARTAGECADYAQARMAAALNFEQKRDLWDHALGKAATGGLIAEFGVWKGRSINHIARRSRPAIVYGFDSFEGLREDWTGYSLAKGEFDLGGRMPAVEGNVRLLKGTFDETLPPFLSAYAQPFSFVHIDSDTYEAARTVLGRIGSRILAGTVIVFDEYFGYRGWRMGEFRAWQEFVLQGAVEYEYVAFSAQSVSVRVIRR
jgi:hypothetical protein